MSSGSDSSLSSLLMIPDQRVSAQDLVRGNYTLAGWLRKRGRLNVIPGARKVFPWLHQFVVLHEGCLYTFKNETAKKPLRAFSLYGYNTVYRAGEVLPAEAPWAFKICHTFPEYKTYYFSAMTEQHMKEWMKQVKHEMKRANNKLKQRTRADGQDEDEQSISYEDIEREIYSDPSQLVITDKTPLPPRQDDESDEEYVDAERPPDTPVLPRIISKPLPPPVKLKPKPKLGKQQVSPEKDLQQGITAEFKERLGVSPNPRKKPVELPVRKPPDGKNFTLTDRVERKPPNLPIRPGHGRTSPSIPSEMAPPPPQPSQLQEDYWSRIHYDEKQGKSAGELIRELGEDGVFLIRPSKSGDCNVLVVFVENMPKLYRIFQTGDSFYLRENDVTFKSTEELVCHYYQNKLPCKIYLKMPYFLHPNYKE